MRLHKGISSSVLVFEVEVHEQREEEAHGDGSDEETVAMEVARGILGTEGETRNDTSQITESNMHSNTDSSFGGATNVIPVPGNSHGDIGVDAEKNKPRSE